MAVSDYDHTRDVINGTVPVDGVELTCLKMPVEEIFFRFVKHREWEVTELSMAKFTMMRDRDEAIVGIPVFLSREFRHGAFYVGSDSDFRQLTDLAGTRVGVPEWTVTATVYARGLLSEAGVPLTGIEWFQAGLEEPGRVDAMAPTLPPGTRYTAVPERSLTEMLLAGDIDAIICPRTPRQLAHGRVRRLLADPLAEAEAHYRASGVFPIMHVLALRADVHERHPWIAMNLRKAFEEAKRRSLLRAFDTSCSWFPVPLAAERALEARAEFGEDPWPYGIEGNRVTLERFLDHCAEQGVTHGRMNLEDMFPTELEDSFRV